MNGISSGWLIFWCSLALVVVSDSNPAMAQKATPAKESKTGDGAKTTRRLESQAPQAASRKNVGASAKRPATVTAANRDDDVEDDDEDSADDSELDEPPVPPQPGTAEWYVRETARLRLEPPAKDADKLAVEKELRQRQQKILDYAQKAIGLTHKDPGKVRVFQMATRHMLEARLQLAMSGDEDQIATLYDEARSFYRRDPKSAAAAEGAQALVSLAYYFAENHPQDAAHWQREFSRQACHFLKAFPDERRRAVPLAYTAGRVCERHGQATEALACFDLLVRLVPETHHAEEAEAIARRLRLPGNPPQVAGQTLENEPFLLDDLLGKPVLLVFWSSDSKAFQSQLAQTLPAIRKGAKAGLQVVGISLDDDRESAVDFVTRQKLGWIQLHSTAPGEQGWNNPVARMYGVFDLPAYWL
ncbi:MAG: hypothetical protein EHM42_07060, partial [Planctomycetaceae bacterium]